MAMAREKKLRNAAILWEWMDMEVAGIMDVLAVGLWYT